MFVIRFVLVSCLVLVILEYIEAECIRNNADELYCEDIKKISREILNESYENCMRLMIVYTKEPLEITAFRNMKKLTDIDISNSRIGIIYSETFKDIPYLEHVYIKNNKIGDIEESAFFNLTKLQEVVISYTDIPFLRKGIFRNVPQLYIINLQNSNLCSIQNDAFYDVPNLKKLYLNNNLLTVVTKDMLNKLTNLDYLNLANNSISIIEKNSFDQTKHLYSLYLERNQLKSLDLDIFPTTGMKYLRSIYLNRNRLMYLPSTFFTRTPTLQEIGLSHNPWFCPCLFEIYRILNLYNITEIRAKKNLYIKEIWNKKLFMVNSCKDPIPDDSPWSLPICINRNVLDNICINTYSQELKEDNLFTQPNNIQNQELTANNQIDNKLQNELSQENKTKKGDKLISERTKKLSSTATPRKN
ncbi:unnamed protein product [Psylliodes chrysocephalus]|uniref:Uncharacterized protein n=1 Tax=Psylliodes chrysocephalus TaxID=3402493 RepID=A0A9P0G3R2_9CUCU|nr:unnamed protein product [Psylliodes chrysocephala]